MISSYACPNCGANVPVEGASTADFVRCRFCATEITLPSQRIALRRQELLEERAAILARSGFWDDRIAKAATRRKRELLVLGASGCGVYAVLFFVGSLILAVVGRGPRTVVALIAIAGGIAAIVTISVIREKRRAKRIAALERERDADLELGAERVRHIDAELARLGEK